MLGSDDDQSFLARLASGEERAFEQFFKDTRAPLIRYVNGIINNPHETEEIVHDAYLTFLELLQVPGRIDPQRNPRAYLFRIALNRAKNLNRRRRRRKVREPELEPQQQPDCERDTVEDTVSVAAAIAHLGESHREVLGLFCVAGLTANEVAQVLGITPATARKRRQRARQALREILAAPPSADRV